MAVSETTLLNAAIQAGLIDNELVARLRPLARAQRLSLLDAVSRERRLPQAAFYLALAEVRGLPFLRAPELDEDACSRLTPGLLARHLLLPVKEDYLAVSDPDDRMGIETVRRLIGRNPPLALAEPAALEALARDRFGMDSLHNRGGEEHNPVVLFDRLMKEAFLRRASDIHLEAEKSSYRMRLRVDGHLQGWGGPLNRPLGESLVSRIKVLAGMDIAESRAAQDGAFTYRIADWDNEEAELRIASIPTRFGERLTLRVLKSDPGRLTLDSLGMPAAMLTRLREQLKRPHGIVLVTGPTGSGKSTTLYAALRELDASAANILTVEDPIEQALAGISQVQVTAKVGFADALRSFLRHDPDVILVGEIRDADTADTAIKAATTGHMVLSTLHTNHALGAITRLDDIGCEPFLLAATLGGVIAQRLVRRLCPRCKTPYPPDADERACLGLTDDVEVTLYRAHGCPACLGSGYSGRIGIFEALWIGEALADAIAEGRSERELTGLANDWYRLAIDAVAKVLAGVTSLSEVQSLIRWGGR